ncbi:MAG: hypothetical protein Q9217_003555 [Psora testacea]
MVTDDIFGKPSQLKFVRPADMLLFANAVCDPPLGQSTVIPHEQQTVNFTVLLESSRSFPEQPWELAISSKSRSKVYRRYFSIDLTKPAHTEHALHFTLKYRVTASMNWKWANETSCVADGELCFQPRKPPDELQNYLKDIDSDLTIHSVPSDSPGAQLWSLIARAKGAEGARSTYTKTCLGTPRSYTRWFATVRTWTPWLAPRHGKAPFAPQQGAVMCSFLRWDGLHLVLLAVSGVNDVLTEFSSDSQGNVMASSRNDREGEGEVHILAAVATTFESANAAVMYHARKIVAGDDYLHNDRKLVLQESMAKDIRPEWMENWYDGLTYCTWNALGQDLTEGKIYNALEVLKEKNINITNLIIDDNWQSLDETGVSQFELGWTDFEANPKGFPKGLKHTATTIRDRYPNIKHIAVWHAILGYWGAVSPHGKIARDYKTKKINKMGGGTFTVVDEPDIDRMYNDFYKFLLSSGVDSVKTDAQFMLDTIADAPDRRRLITAYQDAWAIASLRYFSIKAISCMSQFPQCIFHTQLPLNKPRFMVRNSDDFFPDIPSSHPFHIFTNAHNSLLTSHLNILPDWDMFQTHHEYSTFHAAGRCISGGPIYITDEPGKHDLGLIAQMTAQTIDGRTIILRPSVIGKTINVYTAYEEERLLKVGTFAGGKGGTGILALFNVSQRVLSELVNLRDFPGVETGEEYVVRAHTSGETSSPIGLSSKLPAVSLEVEVKGYEILSAYPLQSFNLAGSTGLQHSATKVTVLGLIGKMTGAAAVIKTDMGLEGNGRLKMQVSLKALGVLGIFISDLKGRSVGDNFLATIRNRVVPQHTVTISMEASVLEIDLEKAWIEMGLQSGYGNEIVVEVLMR